jgi:hypothetical protein
MLIKTKQPRRVPLENSEVESRHKIALLQHTNTNGVRITRAIRQRTETGLSSFAAFVAAVTFCVLVMPYPIEAQQPADKPERDLPSKQESEDEKTPEATSEKKTPEPTDDEAPIESQKPKDEPETTRGNVEEESTQEEPAVEETAPSTEQQSAKEEETVSETDDESSDSKTTAQSDTSNNEDLFEEMGTFTDDTGGESKSIDATRPIGAHVHGSLENQLNGLWLRRPDRSDRFSPYDYTRLRIDVDADLPRGVQVRSDVVGRLFVGETEFDLYELFPTQAFDDFIDSYSNGESLVYTGTLTYQWEDELYIDNAYLKIPVGPLLVSVGKQPLEQGAGYIWNPTDVFVEKEMFDPTYEKEGVISLRTVIELGEIASLDLAVAPDGKFERWNAGGRARLRLGPLSFGPAVYLARVKHTDLEGTLDRMEYILDALDAVDNPEDALYVPEVRRVMGGGEAVLDVEGIRLWVEAAHNWVEDMIRIPDDWWELSTGFEYFFTFETHVMAEYYHYGVGPEQIDGSYTLNDWVSVLKTELRVLGRNLIFLSVDHPVADFWTVRLSSIASFSDVSATVMADVRWDFIQDGELWLLVGANAGEPEDFLSSTVGQGWLRVKVFF